MGRVFAGLLVILVIAAVVVIVKTYTYPFAKIESSKASSQSFPIDEGALKRFSGGIQIATVSNADYTQFNYQPFDIFKEYLQETYPNVFAGTENYMVNNYGIVIHWKGKNSSLKPILFLSHYDVVPPGNYNGTDTSHSIFSPNDKPIPPISAIAQDWEHTPFSGNVMNGRIYGRGTLDMKNMLFSLMEAVNNLIGQQFVPSRDIYFAFGHDEEVGGTHGALEVAKDFKAKGITFDAVYDEGGIISTKGSLSGIDASVALIGCAEKGFWSARVKVKGLGGHSSMPPLQSAIGKAAVIMERLENDQVKPELIPVIEQFFTNIGNTMNFTSRMAIANQWLLKKRLLKTLTNNHTTNALVRTTTALTMMKGSDATNVLAPEVEFVVNFRLLPGNTAADVKKHLENACRGFDVKIEDVGAVREASHISSTNAQGYAVMKRTINKLFPGVVVTPYLTIGGTDAYKFELVSDHVYRFNPVAINNFEQQTIHNNNEYISIENYMRMIHYFEAMIKEYDQ